MENNDSRIISISFRKGNSGMVEESKDVFQEGVKTHRRM